MLPLEVGPAVVPVGSGVVNENWSVVDGRLLLGSREVAEVLVEASVRVVNDTEVLDESTEAVVPVDDGSGVVYVKSSVLTVDAVLVEPTVVLCVGVV